MEDECSNFVRAVDRTMGELANTLHTVVSDLKLKLYDVFSEGERQNIDASKTNMDKVTTLFTCLKTKPTDAQQNCLKALEELKHTEIANKLRERMKNCLPVGVVGKQ